MCQVTRPAEYFIIKLTCHHLGEDGTWQQNTWLGKASVAKLTEPSVPGLAEESIAGLAEPGVAELGEPSVTEIADQV
jgi:hypothetical protein